MSLRVDIGRPGSGRARRELERVIGSGGVALFPADGLYGLACDPIDPVAIDRIHTIKGRDDGKPSAVMYFSALSMRELLGGLGERAASVLAALLPGPFTLVLDNPAGHYPLACRSTPDRLGVRLIDGPLAGVPTPVFQTSANRSGHPASGRLEEIDPSVIAAADLVIDAGPLPGTPSTVIDIARVDVDGSWTVLRSGAVDPGEADRMLAAALSG